MLLKNAVVYNEDFEPIRADLAVERRGRVPGFVWVHHHSRPD